MLFVGRKGLVNLEESNALARIHYFRIKRANTINGKIKWKHQSLTYYENAFDGKYVCSFSFFSYLGLNFLFQISNRKNFAEYFR